MLLLGLFTSNYAILFFLIGLLIVAPLGAWVINHAVPITINSLQFLLFLILSLFMKDASFMKPTDFLGLSYFKVKMSDVCKVIIPFVSDTSGEAETVISSGWMAMTSFFIGYVICNSLQLYTTDTLGSAPLNEPNAPDTQMKMNKRKSQAMFALVSIAIFALIVLAFRFNTGCERGISIILTAVGFGAGGYFWYQLLSQVGEGRLSDIFGIANRLLVPSAIQNGPIACVPIPSP